MEVQNPCKLAEILLGVVDARTCRPLVPTLRNNHLRRHRAVPSYGQLVRTLRSRGGTYVVSAVDTPSRRWLAHGPAGKLWCGGSCSTRRIDVSLAARFVGPDCLPNYSRRSRVTTAATLLSRGNHGSARVVPLLLPPRTRFPRRWMGREWVVDAAGAVIPSGWCPVATRLALGGRCSVYRFRWMESAGRFSWAESAGRC